MSLFEWAISVSPWAAFLAYVLFEVRDKNPDESHRYERALANWTKMLGLSTVGLVAATALSAYYLHQTDDAIHQQLEVMQRDEQPYLTLIDDLLGQPGYEPRPGTKSGGQFFWNIPYKNVGKRAATNFSIQRFLQVGDGKLIELPRLTGQPFMGPGATGFFTAYNPDISIGEFQTAMSKDAGVTVLVEFTYTDPLERKQSTVFCRSRNANGSIGQYDPAACRKLPK